MKYIDLSMDKELKLMVNYSLTTEELMIIKLIFLAQEDHSEFLRTYLEECEHSEFIDMLHNLVEKGILTTASTIPSTINDFSSKSLVFNKNFLKNYLKHSYDMGMELFTIYPSFVNISGKLCSIKNISKNFNSFEEFAFAYGKAIKFDEETHNEILGLVQWAKEQDLIHYGICEFIISFKWLELKELQEIGVNGMFKTNELI